MLYTSRQVHKDFLSITFLSSSIHWVEAKVLSVGRVTRCNDSGSLTPLFKGPAKYLIIRYIHEKKTSVFRHGEFGVNLL